HDYADTGVYHVQQIVVNQWGCEDTLDYDVVIVPYTTLFIPNTFTPNGDGKNDVFMPVGQFVADFHMMIFDRWGNLIYETNDQSMGWDGHANGGNEKAQIDTYVYVVTFHEMYTGNYHRIIGNVNLIR
ncbi:MAG TPA: gliding motility-associated C-terminal domain-containing protein, partial [Bacteroidia bacterium]|nr:gliding motility-associated C-terminal domain-containing protein [Bacteroidia bacterium]